MIPPLLLQAIPRILLFVVPIFITVKAKGSDDDTTKRDKTNPGPETEG
jgi:hypothetical protein